MVRAMKVAMPPTAKMATRITHIISVSPAWVPSLEQLVLIFSQKMWIVNACWTHQSWTSTLLTDSWLIDWCFVFIIHHFEKVSVFLYPASHNGYRFHCWRHLSALTLCLNISLYTFLANIEEAERTDESVIGFIIIRFVITWLTEAKKSQTQEKRWDDVMQEPAEDITAADTAPRPKKET